MSMSMSMSMSISISIICHTDIYIFHVIIGRKQMKNGQGIS